MECTLAQNGMYFAAKWNAFCGKMACVLRQNGTHFAAKWKTDCRKTLCNQYWNDDPPRNSRSSDVGGICVSGIGLM